MKQIYYYLTNLKKCIGQIKTSYRETKLVDHCGQIEAFVGHI